MARIILHIDLNAFFATAEEIRDPSLEGKPLIVGHEGRCGIVSTCSYAARKYGIRSGMPTFQAKKLCPSVIIKHGDYSYYSALSREFFAFVRTYTNLVEIASVDECYCDMTTQLSKVKDVAGYLKNMQLALYNKTKLKCSIGVAPTKFLAKMGSDMKKPMGITIIRKRDIKKLLYPLPIGDMYGIGKKTSPRLIKAGIKTIGDLAVRIDNDDPVIKDELGKFYYTVKEWLEGKGNDEVSLEEWDPKSIGNSTTFMHDTNDISEIEKKFSSLAREVSERAKKENKIGTTVQIVMKNTDFKSTNKSISFREPTNDYEVIFAKAMLLFEKNYKGEMLRLVGVTLQKLIDPKDEIIQMSLFNYQEHEAQSEVKLLINDINRKLKKPLLKRASEAKKNN